MLDFNLSPTDQTIDRGQPSSWDKAFLSYQLHKVWETNITFDLDPWPTDLNINRDHLLIKDYLPTKLKHLWQIILALSVAQGVGDQHDLWPTDLNMNRDHALTKDYLPTKFADSGAKHSWVSSCIRLRDTDIPTDLPTCTSNMPSFFGRGGGIIKHLHSFIFCILFKLVTLAYS